MPILPGHKNRTFFRVRQTFTIKNTFGEMQLVAGEEFEFYPGSILEKVPSFLEPIEACVVDVGSLVLWWNPAGLQGRELVLAVDDDGVLVADSDKTIRVRLDLIATVLPLSR